MGSVTLTLTLTLACDPFFLGKVISRLGGPRHASLTFLEIPSVRVMQQSFAALMLACSAREDDPAWLMNLHVSGLYSSGAAAKYRLPRVCRFPWAASFSFFLSMSPSTREDRCNRRLKA